MNKKSLKIGRTINLFAQFQPWVLHLIYLKILINYINNIHRVKTKQTPKQNMQTEENESQCKQNTLGPKVRKNVTADGPHFHNKKE